MEAQRIADSLFYLFLFGYLGLLWKIFDPLREETTDSYEDEDEDNDPD